MINSLDEGMIRYHWRFLAWIHWYVRQPSQSVDDAHQDRIEAHLYWKEGRISFRAIRYTTNRKLIESQETSLTMRYGIFISAKCRFNSAKCHSFWNFNVAVCQFGAKVLEIERSRQSMSVRGIDNRIPKSRSEMIKWAGDKRWDPALQVRSAVRTVT